MASNAVEELEVLYHQVLVDMAKIFHASFEKKVYVHRNILETGFKLENARTDIEVDEMVSRWALFIFQSFGVERVPSLKEHEIQAIVCNVSLFRAVLPPNWTRKVPPAVKSYLESNKQTSNHCPAADMMATFNAMLLDLVNACEEMQMNNNEMRFITTLLVINNQYRPSPDAELVDIAFQFYEWTYMKDVELDRYSKLMDVHALVLHVVRFMGVSRLMAPLVQDYHDYPMRKDQKEIFGCILFNLPIDIPS